MANKIVAAVKAAGVVGAGGAGFPTHIKIDNAAEVVIANGAECEPLLRAHRHLMAGESEQIIHGLKAVMTTTGASQGYIALKAKYVTAIKNLETVLARLGEQNIQLFFLPDFYPAGDEHVLVHEVTGRIIPEGGIPLNVGAVVCNVETLFNIAQAVSGIPVTTKYVTVTGAVRKPVTIKVPVGTKASELIAAAGGPTVNDYVIIDGGPMMGKIVSENAPVTKTTSGLIVLPRNNPLVTQKNLSWQVITNHAKAACCSCRACTDCCPRYLLGHSLEPHRIMQAVGNGFTGNLTTITRVFLCSECGACETFGCTMGLSPRRVNAELKRLLIQSGVKNPHRAVPAGVRAGREYRRIPAKRLVSRLGLTAYDVEAPLSREKWEPAEVRLPLIQHIGAATVPVVKAGDAVKAGDLIAITPAGVVGANVHASITGTVYAIEDFITIRTEK
ncbi:4Fe-4S dicluster domain-containing protein [Sporolituus thermophilus]|uniref:Na+-translocating ferredoxin:NAD+ oxidoreductase RNF, RnfC subunit n=1 Tax=Sporolituus thermophilus DSM 23256 TaxID=1123285 RepID=A0A1G7M4J8_9FIRM|nr:4Fe-4S dicluster domain-containing protein [Sporolituus thermophilus]SDF56601.1 Na+-translocating ferredoxin:NAD+ oxidoreductase RNF, RnfC subunit [Sporolituus thermophilus DSM 23256]